MKLIVIFVAIATFCSHIALAANPNIVFVLTDDMRPDAETNFENLVLAGDWTATGLPATIDEVKRRYSIRVCANSIPACAAT